MLRLDLLFLLCFPRNLSTPFPPDVRLFPRMKSLTPLVFLTLSLVGMGFGRTSGAQVPEAAVLSARDVQDLVPAPGILSNSAANLHAEGGTLWAGPYLSLTRDGGQTWAYAASDSLFGSRNRVYSLDVEGDVIWVGLGYAAQEGDNSVNVAAGFLVSTDGGETFAYRFPQLDAPGADPAAFDTVRYGVSRLPALKVIVPEESPPWDIDYDPATGDVWVAGFASGVRRSADNGRTWQRVVLPPDGVERIQPDEPYDFAIEPRRGESGSNNHLGFSVLVDETGTVWAGTVNGVNRSRPEDVFPGGERAWTNYSYDGTASAPTGNFVVAIEEQPLPEQNAIWMGTLQGEGEGEQSGVTVTRDGGETFEQVLLGERVYDFAFQGERIYAAARESGLLISDSGGRSWQSVTRFADPGDPDRILRPDVDVGAVATTPDAVWVGTLNGEGVFKSTDGGQTWQRFRTDVPLRPETETPDVPSVETYAYPNPFSPAADRLIRICYDAQQGSEIEVRVFDFAMNLVRRLTGTGRPGGEIAWDGLDESGLRVANGTYFYDVRTGNETARGKILVLE